MLTVPRNADLTDLWAGDVLVIGAGAAGLLISRNLSRAGLQVCLMDGVGVGAAQSSHSHGYMHRGHIYSTPSDALVTALNKGADFWTEEFAGLGVEPEFEQALATFTNPHTAQVAAKKWQAAGLRFESQDRSSHLGGAATFRTEEATYDFTPWLVAAQDQLRASGVTTVQGQAEELVRREQNRRIVGIRARIRNRQYLVRARHYVLAAGTGNLPLIATATRYRGRAINRLSFMAVLESPALPMLSLVSPENETYGLFIVSRAAEDRSRATRWLVSNYLGFADATSLETKWALWWRATQRTLRATTKILDLPDLRCGGYSAPKGELRAMRGRLDVHSHERYALKNVCVASPSKLTLAPLLAEDITREVLKRISGRRTSVIEAIDEFESTLPVWNERWLHTPVSASLTDPPVRSDGHAGDSPPFWQRELAGPVTSQQTEE